MRRCSRIAWSSGALSALARNNIFSSNTVDSLLLNWFSFFLCALRLGPARDVTLSAKALPGHWAEDFNPGEKKHQPALRCIFKVFDKPCIAYPSPWSRTSDIQLVHSTIQSGCVRRNAWWPASSGRPLSLARNFKLCCHPCTDHTNCFPKKSMLLCTSTLSTHFFH